MKIYNHHNPNVTVAMLERDQYESASAGVMAADFPSIDKRPNVVLAVRANRDHWLQFYVVYRNNLPKLTMSLNGIQVKDDLSGNRPSSVEFVWPAPSSSRRLRPGSNLVINVDGCQARYHVLGVRLLQDGPLARSEIINANGRMP